MRWNCSFYGGQSRFLCYFAKSVSKVGVNKQVTVSNPAEVAKTRLQLQGELAKGGVKKVYGSAFDVLRKTWKNEGIMGLQRGLAPAVCIIYFNKPSNA